ncbi:MAG: leucine--tRNA ligase [bacterium]|nr:leucine--tRNA ligase [bacterium]
MKKYIPSEFEQKWAEQWEKDKIYKVGNKKIDKKKEFVLSMFPYPSGAGLHVGHVRVYTGTDVLARFFRMQGKEVLHPMGWDAFGLPAENAAVKAKKNPIDMVPINIANFKKQMKMLGFSYDWDREFATTDPDYYRFTQWLFIQFFNRGLLYKKNTPINYCLVCKTGLAEEEVLQNGTHERCGNKIEKRDLPQWVFKITDYAERLLSDLDGLDWPKGILEMQRNWIGKKEGINITYDVISKDSVIKFLSRVNSSPQWGSSNRNSQKNFNTSSSYENVVDEITCFTTAPVNFGMTFIVVAPEHDLVKKIISGKIKVDEKIQKDIITYFERSQNKTEIERQTEGREKTGVFTGLYATNRVAGWDVPVWVADFVVGHVGTGAVQGCPGHDYKDYEFAKKFKIPIIRVVVGEDGDMSPIERTEQIIVKGMKGKMCNSKFLNGLDFKEGLEKTMDYVEEKGWGKRVVTYHLRDWIFSRQRYWGEPIPMTFCEKCEWVPLPESELPLKLPYVKSYEPTETGESPLSQIPEFVNTKCPKCGKPAKRETDTMPNWAGSCWYFLRFADPKNFEKAWSEKAMEKWEPVDWYLGGAEHAVLHLLYSRFWVKALYDLKLLKFKEPFLRLRNLGMILAEDHRKMSKSFGNVINPDDVVKEFGSDSLRVYEMFMAPFNQEISWSTNALQGSYRFINRVWNMYHNENQIGGVENKHLVSKLQKTILKVTQDIPEVKFNTAIASMMEFINEWENKSISKEQAKQFLQILAPFAPFIADEIWHDVLGEKDSIHISLWPAVNEKEIIEDEINIPVQVNGKVRSVINISTNENTKEMIIEKAENNEKIKTYISGKKYKAIYIEGRILNFVLFK